VCGGLRNGCLQAQKWVMIQISDQDERHRGAYKTTSKSAAAFDADGNQVGAVTVTGASRNTLKGHFKTLCERELLVLHGQGRGAWYSLP